MERVRELLRCTFFFVTLMAVMTASANSQPVKKKAATPVSTRRRPKAASGTSRAQTRNVVVTRKKVNGHWVRTTKVVHAERGPVVQPHPEPERYQQIQQALAANGYYKGEPNGQWNDESVAALKQFQTDRKIPNDGKISSLSLIGLGLGPNREPAPVPSN